MDQKPGLKVLDKNMKKEVKNHVYLRIFDG